MTKNKKKAFTLVEILTTLTVISLLTIFSFISIPKQLIKTRDSIRKSNIRKVATAIEEIYQDTNCYPESIPLCTYPLQQGTQTIINQLPCDPKTKNSYIYVPESSSCPKWFQLYGILENIDDPIIEKIGCTNGCGPICQFNFGIASTNQVLDPYCNEISPTPGPSPEPTEPVDQYVCAPSGDCETYANPEMSGCPDIYINDSECQGKCRYREYRCHDARGKTN
ncbi:MAG: type II secretion system protein [Patescibacteria group bacterium]